MGGTLPIFAEAVHLCVMPKALLSTASEHKINTECRAEKGAEELLVYVCEHHISTKMTFPQAMLNQECSHKSM